MCYQDRASITEKNELTLEQIKHIFLNQIKGIKKVNLIGGEIFVRKDIFEIIHFFDSRGISVHITTNGTLINDTTYKKLSNCSNIQAIGFSIDGTEELHNKMRNSRKAFHQTVQGLKLAKRKFFVFVVSVLTKSNIGFLKEIVELVNELCLSNLIIEFERKYTNDDLREASSVLGFPEQDFPLTVSESKEVDYSYQFLKENIEAAECRAKALGIRIYYLPDNKAYAC